MPTRTLPSPTQPTRTQSKIIRPLGRILAVSLLASAALVGSTATAHAGTSQAITVAGGQATFQHHGEILTATDTRKDGRCVTGTLKFVGAGPNSPIVYEDVEACGTGTVKRKNLNLTEGAWVQLQVCYTGGGQADQCSKWQDGVA